MSHRTNTRLKHDDPRIQHEYKEMQQTSDLREIDDDVEDAATLFEWHALEHRDHPRSPRWFIAIAVGTVVLTVFFLFIANFMAAITTAFLGGLVYYVAALKPDTIRYRIMVDGVAIANTLYHYRDLEAFNVVYEPRDDVRMVVIKSRRIFAPLITLEIGTADPVHIRNLLLEFVPEDLELDEPVPDAIARRIGW